MPRQAGASNDQQAGGDRLQIHLEFSRSIRREECWRETTLTLNVAQVSDTVSKSDLFRGETLIKKHSLSA